MTVKERIIALRLLDKINVKPIFAQEIGLEQELKKKRKCLANDDSCEEVTK